MKIIKWLFEKFGAISVFLILWEMLSRLAILDKLFIPPFSDVALAAWRIFRTGNLLAHIGISLERAVSGFAIAVIAGIPLGLIFGGWFKKAEIALGPLLEFFSQINPFIFFHIVVFILGIEEPTKIIIIFWACVWPIIFSTISGIKHIQPEILKAGRSFGLGRTGLFFKIVLPSAAPSIFVGLRLSAGYSLFMLIAAEMMGCSSGLGWLILNFQEGYQISSIFAAAIIIAFLGLIFDFIIRAAEKKIIKFEGDEGFTGSAD
ncbi:MAG: ABC transporter permease [Brevinematales bacterium]|jgi:NitT/TauT family transport system permease protein